MEKPEEMWEPEQKLQGRVSSIPRLKGKAHPKKPRLGIRCKGSRDEQLICAPPPDLGLGSLSP